MTILPWGEYRPDVADIASNNTRQITNVIPRGDGYGPVSDLLAYTSPLPAANRGGFRALNSDGTITIFAGTSTKLWAMDNTLLTWANVSGEAVCTMTLASPCVITKTAHGLIVGDVVRFSTTGALLTGFTAGTAYYVIATGLTADAFEVSATLGGTAVNGSVSQSGVQSVSATYDYSLGTSELWQFAQYGNFVIAVQPGDVPQVYHLGVSTYFAPLAGTPPTGRYVSVIGEFVLITGIVATPYRAQWCGRSDITNWTSGVGESDFQDFGDGGPVGPVAGGEQSAIILQQYAMRRMTYQPGNPVIFSFVRISEDIGYVAPFSIIKAGQRTFFISNAGFQQSIDGAVPTSIGKESVDSSFIAEWDSTQPQLTFGFPDPRGTRVYWAYKIIGGTAGLFGKILCYDWMLNRWSPITGISGEFVTALAQAGKTLEGLDSLGFTLDTLQVSFDAFPNAFGKEIAAFGSDHKLGFMRGPALEATLETPEQGVASAQKFVVGMRPITDASAVYGQVSSRQNLSDDRTWSPEAARDSAGLIPARVDTRYFRYRNRIPAGTTWAFSAGIDNDPISTGSR